MQTTEIFFPQGFYVKHLKMIGGIKFTHREIDIISFFISGRSSKKIASFLSISLKTIEFHTRNITLKLDCNSREGIVDFIEKSDKLSLIREYYSNLLLHKEFEQSLKTGLNFKHGEDLPSFIIYRQGTDDEDILTHYLQFFLSVAGFHVTSKCPTKNLFFTQLTDDIPKKAHIICLISEERVREFKTFIKEHKGFPQIFGKFLFLFLFNKENLKEDFKEFINLNFLYFVEQKNSYFMIFEIFQKLFPDTNLKSTFELFKKQYALSQSTALFSPPIYPLNTKNLIEDRGHLTSPITVYFKSKRFLASILCFIGIFGGLFLFKNNEIIEQVNLLRNLGDHPQPLSIRSDLVIPMESVFLDRPELLKQIDQSFKERGKIQSLALVGIGGSGKTTLARQYAHQQKANVIWEINAETNNSLIGSFENLAYALSTTESDNKILREMKEIKNLSEKEKEIVEFVKVRLKKYSNWFIIYDNVEKFIDIQKYFPLDEETWGHGKVLITTQDSNLQNNEHINRAIFVKELNETQKLEFFIKLMNNKASLHELQNNEYLIKFLKVIPPFPLDIIVAACYLNATHSSYRDYLESLSKYDKDFTNTQLELLKEAGDYSKTRYSIVTLSLQRLIDTHKDFQSLLLFVSLIHSQNISKKLLSNYVKEDVINNFIYNLKKYSLITNGNFFNDDVTFSVHRSIQPIILSHFKNLNILDNNSFLIQGISNSLEKYINDIIEMEDYSKMKLLVSHCETFLNHRDILKEDTRNSISCSLGSIYFFLGNYTKAKKITEKVFENKNSNIYNISMINGLINLGNVHRELCNYEQAKHLLEKSLKIYKKQFVKHYGVAVRALGSLGNVYRSLGDYKTAKKLFQESLSICEQHLPKNYIHTAYALANLGNVYRELEDYEKAKDLLEKSLSICINYFPQEHMGTAWVMVHLGNVYRKIGNYKKAEGLLTKGLILCKKFLPNSHTRIAQISMYLGYTYKDMGDYEKAKVFLEKSLIPYEQSSDGKKCVEIVRTLKLLGEIYLFNNEFEAAEGYFLKSLDLYKKNSDVEFYIGLEELSEIYLKRSNLLEDQRSSKISIYLRNKSLEYLKKALKSLKIYSPENSLEIRRLEEKLNTLQI